MRPLSEKFAGRDQRPLGARVWRALCHFGLLLPAVAASDPVTTDVPTLPRIDRAALSQATADPTLAPWQRDFMIRLARGGATPRRATRTNAVTSPSNSWSEVVMSGRGGGGLVYDPLRDRIIVLGGYDRSSFFNDVWVLSLASTPAWTEIIPAGALPAPRAGHTTIYDSAGDRVVIFGGFDGSQQLNDAWALTLSGSPTWTNLVPSSARPPERTLHSAIYDAASDRMVVFGGWGKSGLLNDVWDLSLGATPTWSLPSPAGDGPTAREGHSAIYDPVREQMVVFGGDPAGTWNANDVWTLTLSGPQTWTQLTPGGTPPSARNAQSAIYDPSRDRVVVFGGENASYLNDTWALSLSGTPTWTALSATGAPPAARREHGAVYDPVRDRMIVFGGDNYDSGGYHFLSDAWALSFAGAGSWAPLAPEARPDVRYDASAIYDPLRDRLIVFGGDSGADPYFYNDVWSLSLSAAPAWTKLQPVGTPPNSRMGSSAIYDPARDRLVIFGGADYEGYNDVWALSLAGPPAWTQLSPSGTPPSTRYAHSATYDPVRDRMVVFGGIVPHVGVLNDTWALSLSGAPAWSPVTPLGTPPIPRGSHSAIYDPLGDRLVVFGGDADTARVNDVWALSLGGASAWSQLNPTGLPPSPRGFSGTIYDPTRDRMVVFGGSADFFSYDGDVWALDLLGPPAWEQLSVDRLPPSPRAFPCAIYDAAHDRMVVFAGYEGSSLADTWALTFSGAVAGVGGAYPGVSVGELHVPAPNPSVGATSVTFSLARPGRVRLAVYDASGRLVRTLVDAERPAGTETVQWNGALDSGTRAEAGLYFIRLLGPGTNVTRRVALLR